MGNEVASAIRREGEGIIKRTVPKDSERYSML